MRFWKPRTVPGTPVVGIAVATWLGDPSGVRVRSLGALVASFRCQTYTNWKMEITHDGPLPQEMTLLADEFRDLSDVEFVETATRTQKFGHPHRQAAIDRLIERGCEWIGLTNDDNYYVPVYLEWMLSEALKHSSRFVYCDCVHSHKMWKPLAGEVRRGHIDLGSFLVHRDVAKKVKFDRDDFAADWDYIARLKQQVKRPAKVAATLFVHN